MKQGNQTRGKVFFFGVGLLLALALFSGNVLRMAIQSRTGLPPVISLTSGTLFTSLFLLGFEFWPWLLLGKFLACLWAHESILTSLSISAGAITPYLVSIFFLKKVMPLESSLTRLKHLYFFGAIAAIATPFISSSLQFLAQIYLSSNVHPASNIFKIWQMTYFSQVLSIIITGAFFIHLKNDHRPSRITSLRQKCEAVLIFSAILATSTFVLTPLHTYYNTLLVRPYFLFTLMLCTALRYDLLGATTTSLMILLTSSIGELFGFSTFSNNLEPSDQVLMLQMVIAAICSTGLLVAVTVREKSDALDVNNEFFDIASHELRTPITSLKLQLKLLQRNLDRDQASGQADVRQKPFLLNVENQVDRLVTIIANLLDVSRAERGLVTLERKKINLSELIHQLLDRLSGDFQNAKCPLKVNLQEEIIGNWDQFRIEQTLENLLANAIKYAPGKLIECNARTLDVDHVEITIRDHGPGIDPSKHRAIFDRFVRAENARNVQGLGLGLFISKRIVEAHGGKIHVESVPFQGSSFIIQLPTEMSTLSH